jgi:hypothetical protein
MRGDPVRVRSRDEILATLDADGTLDGLPFMPEMLEFAGRVLPVAARAHKTCDTINGQHHRRLDHTVHLAGARCDGSAHGGCQAGCLLFWREEWLEHPAAPGRAIAPAPPRGSGKPPISVDTLSANTTLAGAGERTRYRCQATELLRASRPVRRRELWQYAADVRSGNTGPLTVLRGMLLELLNAYQRASTRLLPRWLQIRGGREYPFVAGTGTGARTPVTGMRAGDWVQVRSKAEIMATLGPDNLNRRMLFDAEMLPYCGGRFRVERVVERILDEGTGEMIKLTDCVVLEGVVCQGIYHRFCPRAVTPYWREAWLRRVAPGR